MRVVTAREAATNFTTHCLTFSLKTAERNLQISHRPRLLPFLFENTSSQFLTWTWMHMLQVSTHSSLVGRERHPNRTKMHLLKFSTLHQGCTMLGSELLFEFVDSEIRGDNFPSWLTMPRNHLRSETVWGSMFLTALVFSGSAVTPSLLIRNFTEDCRKAHFTLFSFTVSTCSLSMTLISLASCSASFLPVNQDIINQTGDSFQALKIASS